jgi:hypothetical protein
MSRTSDYTFKVIFLIIVAIFVVVLLNGCATSDPPPPCIPEIKWLTPPPEKITVVVTFSVEVPDDPVLNFIEFEHDVILTDPEAFVELLYNDLITCTESFANAKIELVRIKAAQKAAVEEAGAGSDPDG